MDHSLSSSAVTDSLSEERTISALSSRGGRQKHSGGDSSPVCCMDSPYKFKFLDRILGSSLCHNCHGFCIGSSFSHTHSSLGIYVETRILVRFCTIRSVRVVMSILLFYNPGSKSLGCQRRSCHDRDVLLNSHGSSKCHVSSSLFSHDRVHVSNDTWLLIIELRIGLLGRKLRNVACLCSSKTAL